MIDEMKLSSLQGTSWGVSKMGLPSPTLTLERMGFPASLGVKTLLTKNIGPDSSSGGLDLVQGPCD